MNDTEILVAITERLVGGRYLKDENISPCVGLVIEEMTFFNSTMYIVFATQKLSITNDDPNCCANKYLVCDDDLEFAKGATFTGIVRKTALDQCNDDGGVHEISFADIVTSKGVVQLAAHNEHNGYYGGIDFSFALNPV